MEDTANPYLEVERRDPFLGILGRGLGRREEFAFVNLCRFDSSWPPFAVGRARPKIVRTCNLQDCVVRFGSVRVVPGAALSKHVEIHCSGYIFRSQSVCRIRRLCSREAPCRCVMGSQVGDLEMSQHIFRLSEVYTNHGHFLRSGATRSPWACLLVAGPAFWSDLGFPFLLSKSITTDFTAWRCYHVSCTLSAPWRRYIAMGLLTSTRPTPSCCFTARCGLAVSQNHSYICQAPCGHGKIAQGPGEERLCYLFFRG